MVDINIDGQYQINGVPVGGGSSNPSLIDLSVSDGTVITGTTAISASRILTIPANTFTTNGMLEFVARYFKTGASAYVSYIYLNTSPTLTGATQIAYISSTSSFLVQAIRTARINSNVLSVWPTAWQGVNDYATTSSAPTTVTFNTSVDNYIIFAVSLADSSNTAVVQMSRIVKYLEV